MHEVKPIAPSMEQVPADDVWHTWNAQLSASSPDRAVDDEARRGTTSRLYASAVGVLVAVVVVLCILGPSWVTHAPTSALRSRSLIASRIILIGIACAGVTVAAPLCWKHVRAGARNVSTA